MQIMNESIREELSKSKRFTVYRAVRKNENTSFILKTLDKKAARDPNIIKALKHEYHLLEQIDSENVIKAIDWIDDKDYAVMVLEDINGSPLKEDIKRDRFQVERFIELALKVTTGLTEIHGQNIIHKDINPTNIIWNAQTNRLQIIDFDIASKFLRSRFQRPG